MLQNIKNVAWLYSLKKGLIMAQSIEVMEQRYQMLLNRKGKNSENVGIMRKLRRKINKAKNGIVLS
nr:MAG TPA: hypothetical protein [Caudoviricetes sp.]